MASHSRYTKELASIAVAQICQTVGWNSSLSSPLNIMIHVMDGYFKELARNIHQYSDHFGHGNPSMEDVVLAFYEMGISGAELENFLENVTPVLPAAKVPAYPVKKESQLRFLKPGSREVVTRPVHVHEHLPAMYPELEEETYPSVGTETVPETFKRPGEPPAVNEPKKIKLEEECLPMREVLSVMMTTSGFLSPAREGKLPESRLPVITSDCRSSSPSSHSYPTVPPEVKGEFKKSKKSQDDAHVQKLIGMKETSKLKAFKGIKVSKLGDSSGHSKIKSKEHKHHHHHHHRHHKKDKFKDREQKNKERREKFKEHKEKVKEHREKNKEQREKEHEGKDKEHKEKEHTEKEVKEKEKEHKEKDKEFKEKEFKDDIEYGNKEQKETRDKDLGDKRAPLSISPPPTPDVQLEPMEEEIIPPAPVTESIEKITSEPDKVKLNIFKKLQTKPKDEKDKEKEREKEKEKEKD
uniref:Transcription initiation factor TFIID subunit 3 n=1 Tax=Cacopsylla melanoneura TaxID=428564 RepID=A0A8D8VU57_9HEMI